MPNPDQTNHRQRMPFDANDLFKGQPETRDSFAEELAKLRDEIAALRAELAPVSSPIMTGWRVLDEFKKLASASA